MTARPFDIALCSWGAEHHPKALEALLSKDDPEWINKCLGSIFRKRASLDPAWLFSVAEESPTEVRRLAAFIGEVCFGDIAFPGRMGWTAWLAAIETTAGFDWEWARPEIPEPSAKGA